MRTRSRTQLLFTTVFIALCPLFAIAEGTNKAAEKAAVKAAETWLVLVDGGKYAQSWETAAGYLKKAVEKKQFEKSLNAARTPLGKLKKRTLQNTKYRTTLPGAPDGKYVIIQYRSSFTNKASATETITPMLDKDKKWKVSGYYIK